jgi:hypothetical protein
MSTVESISAPEAYAIGIYGLFTAPDGTVVAPTKYREWERGSGSVSGSVRSEKE